MCEIYGFCGSHPIKLNKFTNEFWSHSKIHKDGFGFYLADKHEYYTNSDAAYNYLTKLMHKSFTSSLALCHIRFKTHGESKIENCHPFIKYDSHGIQWALIHNGYTDDNNFMKALSTIQSGETDSERLLLYIIEMINSFYEHSWIEDKAEFLDHLYLLLRNTLRDISTLGKTNLIFTDNYTNNMYVYMNHPNTLFYFNDGNGVHISTVPLTNDIWTAVPANKLFIFNNGKLIQ